MMFDGQSRGYGVLSLMAVIVVAQVFVLTPFAIYAGNAEEISAPLLDAYAWYLLPAIASFLLLILPGLLLPLGGRRVYTLILAALGLLLWVQGGLIVWDYGLLDGRSIDWSEYPWRGWLDAALWIAVLAIVVLFHRHVGRALLRFALLIFLVQILLAGYAASSDRQWLHGSSPMGDEQALAQLYQFSRSANVLHLLLDGFQSDIFEDLLVGELARFGFRGEFNGFTFFPETLAAFPYTRFSVPSFLGEKIYHNQLPKNEFIKKVLREESVLNIAYDNGYEVDLASEEYWAPLYAVGKHSNSYTIPFNIHASQQELQANAASRLLDLSLFRLVPHFLKQWVYNDQKWLVNPLFVDSEYLKFFYFSHTAFLNALIDNMRVSRDAPVYKFIHVMNTHNPMVVDPECGYAGMVLQTQRNTLSIQSKCTLDTVVRLFRRMKELGIYDNSLIIVHADHGGWVPTRRFQMTEQAKISPTVVSLASPLLAIKPAGQSGDFNSSATLASLTDLPATIAALMNWENKYNGQRLFDADAADGDNRTRQFYFYAWQKDAWETDHTGPIQEFVIKGSHFTAPWVLGRVFNPPQQQSSH